MMITKCVPLYVAALKGDWESAKSFGDDKLKSRITEKGETALHIAAAAENVEFVERLVNHIRDTAYLETENINGNTALCYAATTGIVRIAKAILDAHSNQHAGPANNSLPNRGTLKPLSMAALLGRCKMVKYLLHKTDISGWSNEQDRTELFINLIRFGLCDEALKMLKNFPELATKRNRSGDTALFVLAREPELFVHETQSAGWRKYTTALCGRDNGNQMISRSEAAVNLVKELHDRTIHSPDLESGNKVTEIARPLLAAAEEGNDDFIIELIRCDPENIWRFDQHKGTIFHIAVRNRHESIFSLLYKLGSFKDLIADQEVSDNTNMLHLAAELAPPAQLNVVSGAALQMQRELLWFKEVERIVQSSYRDRLNSENKTPLMLFNEKHHNLMDAGEKWMKETAKSSMVVAALIATVMFTTAFTVPGGYNNLSGEPIFEKHKCFLVFSLADALALFCSSTSILMFHSIITSRYTEKDFMESLPFRLMVGVTSLFASVAAMMVAFCATFLLYYPRDNVPWIFALFALFACVPSLYVSLKYPLLVDLIRSTHDSRFMFQSRKQLFL